jgi:23S rRNA C2498 (ribose-2'-O)-methylase RlmM
MEVSQSSQAHAEENDRRVHDEIQLLHLNIEREMLVVSSEWNAEEKDRMAQNAEILLPKIDMASSIAPKSNLFPVLLLFIFSVWQACDAALESKNVAMLSNITRKMLSHNEDVAFSTTKFVDALLASFADGNTINFSNLDAACSEFNLGLPRLEFLLHLFSTSYLHSDVALCAELPPLKQRERTKRQKTHVPIPAQRPQVVLADAYPH